MPSWTDDNGVCWFNKEYCKRCYIVCNLIDGEIPLHKCVDEYVFGKSSNLVKLSFNDFKHLESQFFCDIKYFNWLQAQCNKLIIDHKLEGAKNFRAYILGDRIGRQKYVSLKNNDCSKNFEVIVKHKDGIRFKIGFNNDSRT